VSLEGAAVAAKKARVPCRAFKIFDLVALTAKGTSVSARLRSSSSSSAFNFLLVRFS